MTHRTDIRGNPWRACEACPHDTPHACASRFHRPLCGLFAADPDTWGPRIAAMPAEDRPGRDTRCRPPWRRAESRPGPEVRVGLVMPGLMLGGGERWGAKLLELTRGDPIRWVGAAPMWDGGEHAELIDAVERHCPIIWDRDGGIHRLASMCDVIIGWGSPDLFDRLAGTVNRVVMVAQGMCEWTRNSVRQAERADVLVGVAEVSRRAFPPDQQARVRIYRNIASARPATISREEQLRRWGLPPTAKVLGYCGRFSGEKNPLAVVRAVPHLPRDWYAVMVGPDQMHGAVHAEVAALGVSDRVILTGVLWEPGDAINAFTVPVLPSFYEGCSIALIEYWWAGKAAVATPVGLIDERPDLVELIPREPTGEQIAAAALRLDADPARRAELVRRTTRFIEAEVTPEVFRENYRRAILDAAAPYHPAKKAEKAKEAPRDGTPSAPSAPPAGPSPAAPRPTFDAVAWKAALARINQCPHRGCKVGCNRARCERDGRLVTIGECKICVEAADAPAGSAK